MTHYYGNVHYSNINTRLNFIFNISKDLLLAKLDPHDNRNKRQVVVATLLGMFGYSVFDKIVTSVGRDQQIDHEIIFRHCNY